MYKLYNVRLYNAFENRPVKSMNYVFFYAPLDNILYK